MTPREAASAAELARELRARVLRGDYSKAGTVPSRLALKDEFNVSAETASVALRMLAAEGLIRLEQGKRSVVLPVRVYRAEVTVPFSRTVGKLDRARAERRVRVQADDDPAVGESITVAGAGKQLRIELDVTAADSGRAAARAMGIAVHACPGEDWDVAAASVSARPA